MMYLIFGDNLLIEEYQLWLSDFLSISKEELLVFLDNVDCTVDEPGRGRQLLPKDQRQNIYNFWILNSELSVKRSNEHMVKTEKDNLKIEVAEVGRTICH